MLTNWGYCAYLTNKDMYAMGVWGYKGLITMGIWGLTNDYVYDRGCSILHISPLSSTYQHSVYNSVRYLYQTTPSEHSLNSHRMPIDRIKIGGRHNFSLCLGVYFIYVDNSLFDQKD
jgi:hypothetical protein